ALDLDRRLTDLVWNAAVVIVNGPSRRARHYVIGRQKQAARVDEKAGAADPHLDDRLVRRQHEYRKDRLRYPRNRVRVHGVADLTPRAQPLVGPLHARWFG